MPCLGGPGAGAGVLFQYGQVSGLFLAILIRLEPCSQTAVECFKSCEFAFRNYFCILKEPSLFPSLSLMKFGVPTNWNCCWTEKPSLWVRLLFPPSWKWKCVPWFPAFLEWQPRPMCSQHPRAVHLILELSGPGLPSRTYRTSEIQLCLICSGKRSNIADVTYSPEGHCRIQMFPVKDRPCVIAVMPEGHGKLAFVLVPFRGRGDFCLQTTFKLWT